MHRYHHERFHLVLWKLVLLIIVFVSILKNEGTPLQPAVLAGLVSVFVFCCLDAGGPTVLLLSLHSSLSFLLSFLRFEECQHRGGN